MTKTAELPLPATDQLEDLSADPLATEIPAIKPKMARLLELTQANGTSVTPREINAQLDRVLRDYDELTALYAETTAASTANWLNCASPAVRYRPGCTSSAPICSSRDRP